MRQPAKTCPERGERNRERDRKPERAREQESRRGREGGRDKEIVSAKEINEQRSKTCTHPGIQQKIFLFTWSPVRQRGQQKGKWQ